MANIQTAVEMICRELGDSSADAKAYAKSIALMTYADLIEEYPWSFVEQRDGLPCAFTATNAFCTVSSDDVGRILFLGDQYRKEYYSYMSPKAMRSAKNDGTPFGSQNVSSPAVFSISGYASGRPVLEVAPAPSVAKTLYLYYCQKGKEANYTLMPDGMQILHHHKTMSVIAPPQKIDKSNGAVWWNAIKKNAYDMYQLELANAIVKYGVPVNENGNLPYVDASVQDTFSDIYNY